MKVLGKDIGTTLDAMYVDIERRVIEEADSELRIVALSDGALSSVDWTPGLVTISVHSALQRGALPHVLGVALQHVRQHLDRYPDVVEGPTDVDGGDLIRVTLHELIMAPEAEAHLAPLNLNTTWETEQRHAALKELLKNTPADWNEAGAPGNAFAALQYARFAIEHPPTMWASLRASFAERIPVAAERGAAVVARVQEHGWADADGCIGSFIAVRKELHLEDCVRFTAPHTGELV